jgi:hypothetical protein
MQMAKRLFVCLATVTMLAVPVQNVAAQTSSANPSAVKHLLDAGSVMFSTIQSWCRTDACKTDAQQLLTLIQNARQDDANGVLTSANLKNFLQNMQTVTKQLHGDILNSMSPAEKQKYGQCKSCQAAEQKMAYRIGHETQAAHLSRAVYHPGAGHIVMVQENPCQECQTVFEEALAICAIYMGDCPPCAYACFTVDAYEYEACLANFGGCN